MTEGQENSKYFKTLPQRIRKTLEKKNMSRKELAEKTGVSRQRIGYYCDGTNVPDAEILAKIATVLGVSADYLLGLVETENTSGNLYISSYSDAIKILYKMADALKCEALVSYGMNPYDDSLDDIDLKEIGTNELLKCYFSYQMNDTAVYDFFRKIDKTLNVIDNVPIETKNMIRISVRNELLKYLQNVPLPNPLTLSLDDFRIEGDPDA